ncbi:hypothetical protein GQ42DRAFT_164134 [Ramicandelaber brevisporus]|nr:hypothetical protein GQ42DRAFT_164134 [Ramicandelaber brevisporus]
MTLAKTAKHDSITRLLPFLDRQLAFPLLHFLSEHDLYPAEDLQKAKFELLDKTNLIEFTRSLYSELPGAASDAAAKERFDKRQAAFDAKLADLEAKSEKIRSLIENENVVKALKTDKLLNIRYLQENFGVTNEAIEPLYHLGYLHYSAGNHGAAADMLYHFSVLSVDPRLTLNAQWGKLACEIMLASWDRALDELRKLADIVDKGSFESPLVQMQQRTWVIHWALFVYFNHPRGRDAIVDMFLLPQYINTIQTSCPWILRYLAAALVMNKRRRAMMSELIKAIQCESSSSSLLSTGDDIIASDPVTGFLACLYLQFDFDGAQQRLAECAVALQHDYFLATLVGEFMENARCFLAEVYCQVHQRVSIKQLIANLNMEEKEGEQWIVHLIRDTRMDAKIDFQNGIIIMNQQVGSVYQQVIEKTKGLAFGAQLQTNTIKKREKAIRQAAAQAAQAAMAAAAAAAAASNPTTTATNTTTTTSSTIKSTIANKSVKVAAH